LKLCESAWYLSYDITGKDAGAVKVLVRESIPFPFLRKDDYGYVVCLPNLRRLGQETIEYQGIVFDIANEVHHEIVWNLFKASVGYLSLCVIASNFEAYRDLVKGMKEETALTAISLIEDSVINAYVKTLRQSLLPDITFADAVSYLLLKPAEYIRNERLRFASSILSLHKTGMVKGRISDGMMRDAKNVVGALQKLEEETARALSDGKEPANGDAPATVDDDAKRRVFSTICEKLSSYSGSISEVPSFLYMNHLSGSSLFVTNIEPPAEDMIERTIKGIADGLNLKIDFNMDALRNEATQAIRDWMAKEKKREKILDKYRLMGEGTRFKDFVFPEEDYAEFLRRRVAHSKTIRRITNRLAVYYNLSGEDFRRESGFLDLQQAIQVVASRSQRSDVFMEDTLRYRGQTWAVLVDVSLSLKNFAGEVKDVVLCLTEVSRKLFAGDRSLGIFAFDDRFYVIKDFAENHSRPVCARIGGVEHSGLTYLADGIKMASQVLRKQYEETKVLIVVSDGFPSGYKEAAEETKEQIGAVLRSGIHVIGIGIDSSGIKDYFPTNCVVRTPYELMKRFVDTFFQYASMM